MYCFLYGSIRPQSRTGDIIITGCVLAIVYLLGLRDESPDSFVLSAESHLLEFNLAFSND